MFSLLLLACATDTAPDTSTEASAAGVMTWEVHRIECVDNEYLIPAATQDPTTYDAVWITENEQGERSVKAAIERINQIRLDVDDRTSCNVEDGTLVVTYGYWTP